MERSGIVLALVGISSNRSEGYRSNFLEGCGLGFLWASGVRFWGVRRFFVGFVFFGFVWGFLFRRLSLAENAAGPAVVFFGWGSASAVPALAFLTFRGGRAVGSGLSHHGNRNI